MITIPKNKKVVLFDGICNLCNSAVTRIIKYDKKNTFLFVAIQSERGQKIINYLKIDITKIDTIILYEPGVSYDLKSTAVLKVMLDFGGIWQLTRIFWIFPKTVRNRMYDYIAKNRYKWYGKKDSCMIPTKKIKAKFLN